MFVRYKINGFLIMRKCYLLLSLLGFFVVFWGISDARAQQFVNDIRVLGTQRIEPTTVLSYLEMKKGDPITRSAMDSALKGLFSTGLFVDVTLRQDGSILIVEVVENPVINEIAFEGNDDIDDVQLLSEIQLRPRQVFTRTKVQSDVTRLYQVYRRNGLFSVSIDPKVIQLDQNRVNLVFEIAEGGVTTIEKISFVGNKVFDDDRLRSEISTKENRWYRFYASDDRYDPDRLSFDQELLRRFYLSKGYADFRLISSNAELSNDGENFFVTFTVEEGERYKIGSINIDAALRNFDASVLEEDVNIEVGDWYNADRMQEVVDRMTDHLGDLQYAFVTVTPDVQRNRDNQTVDITYRVGEAPRVFVERIDVNGNVRTLDKVIRREMKLVEGDPFNRSKLARSEQRIRNLDFFETVDVDVRQGSAPDRSVVDINVAEKSTGELSIGAGFSTNDGPLADFGIRERNLLGKGQDLSLSAVVAGTRTQFELAFTEPHFLGRDLSAGFQLFHTQRDFQDESSFDQRRSGGGLSLGYPLSERWRQTFRYRAERNDITDVDDDASLFIRNQEGKRDTSAISQRLVYDSRDSVVSPTEGFMFWFDTEVAGLGGDAQYLSGRSGGSYFVPLADQWILNLLAEGGAIGGYGDEDVQINERFFIGSNTFRGFERSGIGPRDIATRDALGGNFFYRGTAEIEFPLGLPEELGIKGHLFNDIGSLFDIDDTGPGAFDESSIRASGGIGLSWRSPFGPLRLNFAQPYVKEDFDEEEKFQFSFGTRF